mgnify:CR=1 FL=1
MLSEESLKEISFVFCGDTEGYYSYKSGSELVAFFNKYYSYNDMYGQGFPSRWRFVYNKILSFLNTNKFDNFLKLILGKKYIISELKCTEVESVAKSQEVFIEFNRIIRSDGCIITHVGDKYYLTKENDDLIYIGNGGFATVYRQKSTGLILKKLKDDYVTDEGTVSRFKREYNITKSLGNVIGIIKVFDFSEDSYSYTMEEADTTLEKLITENSINEATQITYIRQILYIMAEVHNKNIIHRDISPNNIFILRGMIKIADFGLGKDLNMFNSHQTLHTNAIGQYRYCAPEQFMMLRNGGKQSDVFSLGRLINLIMLGDPMSSNHFLRTVTEKATNQNPSFRYLDAGELLKFVEKSIKYHKDKENHNQFFDKARSGILDQNVEIYIYEMNGEKICNEIILNKSKFDETFFKFMALDESHAIFIIQGIEENFRDMCKTFPSYDPIASFVYKVIIGKFPFVIKELSANILRYIAYDVNRFSAQHLVEKAISIGLEPFIQEILE